MTIKKIIFWDIDGTLLHCGSDGRKALNRTFLELYDIEDAFGSSDIGGAMDSMILDGIMKSHGIKSDLLPEIILRYQEVLADILDKNDKKRILPGVGKLLDTISESRSAENALLTSNLRIGAMTKLKSLEIDKYFKIGGFGDEPGEKWDAARQCISEAEAIYNTAFTQDNLYLIGDSVYDVLCAKKVGMVSIAVSTGWSDEEALLKCKPDYYFHNLSNTDSVLDAIKL